MSAVEQTRALSRAEAEDFLYHEADLLDEWRLDEWLALFTSDAVYWLPGRHGDADPQRDASLVYDDRDRLKDRIFRLTEGPAHSQIPPSATRRLIANVRVKGRAGDDLLVHSNFVIYEVRRNQQRAFAGRYEHRLRPEGGTWRIAARTATLVNCEDPLYNLTFMV
jgi:p-cumate 2,3-dioxygenase beta subunit